MAKIMRYRDGRPRATAEWLLYYHVTDEGVDEDWSPWRDHAKDFDTRAARDVLMELQDHADQERAAGIEHPFSYTVRDNPGE